MITTQQITDVLNHAWATDPDAMYELIETQVEVNDDLAAHPVIQVRQPDPDDAACFLTPLGLLNGIAIDGEDKWIIAHFAGDEDGNTTKLLGFTCHAEGTVPSELEWEEQVIESIQRGFERWGLGDGQRVHQAKEAEDE